MKRFYFSLTDSRIIEAETEAVAREKLAGDLWYARAGVLQSEFALESVEDA